jgi:outer membrane receptor for ferrienterochelin and colicin
VNFGSATKLRNETSQSFQGELNTRLLRNTKQIREIELRADYSYTVLKDLIQIQNGVYANSGKRAIHAVEAYARVYLQGDHTFTASYSFLQSQSTDQGQLRGFPNHFFSIGGTFSVVKHIFDLNTNLNVFGAYEDPNRVPSGKGPFPDAVTQSRSTDLTWDRLTPVALLQVGARVRFFNEKVALSAQFYNVLNQKFYYPDFFYDITPTTEMTPTPAPGFSFFASVSYHP